ncbi:MAG: hypothetical protein NW224_22615 [Leptolyngbyaceae cyanobacterium bins.302]|nr:hypothetical protein [Leptolyngbyaceae cyanobacterium bins.302]
MFHKLFALFSIGAIALSATPSALAQTARSSYKGPLKAVMLDQAQLSATQRSAFQRYLQTANLPPTQVGRRCQQHGKPQVWCLVLDPDSAQQVYQQLKSQPVFGSATEIHDLRRLRDPKTRTTGI